MGVCEIRGEWRVASGGRRAEVRNQKSDVHRPWFDVRCSVLVLAFSGLLHPRPDEQTDARDGPNDFAAD